MSPILERGALPRRSLTLNMLTIGVLSSGCIMLPVPTPKAGHGLIGQETIAAIRPDQTTRLDVLFTLGEPQSRLNDDRQFIYEWQEAHSGWVVGVAYLGGGVHFTPRLHALAVVFTPDGAVVRLKEFDWSSSKLGFGSFPDAAARRQEEEKWFDQER